MIYLGPEDRYPRWLYWCTLFVIIVDLCLAVLQLAQLHHVDPKQVFYHRIVIGMIFRVAIPPVVLCTVWIGRPIGPVIYAIFKVFTCFRSAASAYGTRAIGESVDIQILVLILVWNAAAAVISAAYGIIRMRQDRSDMRIEVVRRG